MMWWTLSIFSHSSGSSWFHTGNSHIHLILSICKGQRRKNRGESEQKNMKYGSISLHCSMEQFFSYFSSRYNGIAFLIQCTNLSVFFFSLFAVHVYVIYIYYYHDLAERHRFETTAFFTIIRAYTWTERGGKFFICHTYRKRERERERDTEKKDRAKLLLVLRSPS